MLTRDDKFRADIIAGTAIFGCLVLIGMGKDGTVHAVLASMVGYIFGKRSKSSN
jgi:hypothetical protein